MQELSGKTAVVTGAASGIGLALARRFGAEGMRVVLADVEALALEAAVAAVAADGVAALGVHTDVTCPEQVDALARCTVEAFGKVHVVCNNAGVFAAGLTWDTPLADWHWVLGVNLFGVLHGLRSFVPLLEAHGEEAHVVNTASMAGLVSSPFSAPYTVSKHAVVALSEALYHELTLKRTRIGVTVLCPEAVATRIGESERNRDPEAGASAPTPEQTLAQGALRQSMARALAPEVMADRVVAAIRAGRFYALADDADWMREASRLRCEDVRLGRNPTFAAPRF
jgi:NAD(P)-dependent dehydrogenase (short-subunit alcohol dehydrogenase family)